MIFLMNDLLSISVYSVGSVEIFFSFATAEETQR